MITAQKSSRNIGIDLLRVFCVLYIVGFWHLLNYTGYIKGYNNPITESIKDIVLGLFTLISGYLIGIKPINFTIAGIAEFYKTKLLRIYPLYLLAIVLFYLYKLIGFKSALTSIFAMSMIVTPAPLTLWFLTMVLFFYLITPLLLYVYEKFGLLYLLILSGTIIFIFTFMDHFQSLIDRRLIYYFPPYILGLLLAKKDKYFNVTYIPTLVAFSVTSILLLFSHDILPISKFLLRMPMVAIIPIFLFKLSEKIQLTSKLLLKFISIISYSSFAMYLFHRPILITLIYIYFPIDPKLQFFCLVFVFLPIVTILSYFVQNFYDKVRRGHK